MQADSGMMVTLTDPPPLTSAVHIRDQIPVDSSYADIVVRRHAVVSKYAEKWRIVRMESASVVMLNDLQPAATTSPKAS